MDQLNVSDNTNTYEDIEIKCKECGNTFIFTAEEQRFYSDKNLVQPKRCKNCRDARRIDR